MVEARCRLRFALAPVLPALVAVSVGSTRMLVESMADVPIGTTDAFACRVRGLEIHLRSIKGNDLGSRISGATRSLEPVGSVARITRAPMGAG